MAALPHPNDTMNEIILIDSDSDNEVELLNPDHQRRETFIIEGQPRPLQRNAIARSPRGKSWIFQTLPNAERKLRLQNSVKEQLPLTYQMVAADHPLSIRMEFYMARPQSHFTDPSCRIQLKATAPHAHICVPDTDNLVKLVQDALNGVLYHDDKQLVTIVGEKLYDNTYPYTGRTILTLKSWNGNRIAF